MDELCSNVLDPAWLQGKKQEEEERIQNSRESVMTGVCSPLALGSLFSILSLRLERVFLTFTPNLYDAAHDGVQYLRTVFKETTQNHNGENGARREGFDS
jgi:hypothetical protein